MQASAPAKIFVYSYGELYQHKERLSLELLSMVVLHVFYKKLYFWFLKEMRIKNAMLYSAVQLRQLVTVMQHFKQNFVITGPSLSLTPSPLGAIPEAVPLTSVK